MEESRIKEQLKEIFEKEGLSWAKIQEETGHSSRSSIRRNLLGWLEKAEFHMNKIGYEIILKKIEK